MYAIAHTALALPASRRLPGAPLLALLIAAMVLVQMWLAGGSVWALARSHRAKKLTPRGEARSTPTAPQDHAPSVMGL
jgi:hypothetical protein